MRVFQILVLSCFMIGCSLAPNAVTIEFTNNTPYPMVISNLPESETFPLKAAGFDRGKTIIYDNSGKNVSVHYNLISPENQIVSTFYWYPTKGRDMREHFDELKGAVTQLHSNAELLSEETFNFAEAGATYVVWRACYQISAKFMGKNQEVFSELLLWTRNGSFFKLRSSSPMAQREITSSKARDLIDAVEWTDLP